MNWRQGFKRLSYGILLAAWVIGIADVLGSHDPDQLRENGTGLLGFTIGWLLFHHLVAWIARGFSKPRD